ncbi:ADP-forming succinate--CoA ligase subunit beta [Candidatus Bathyarchaeota archaeon]|nr:MAG: ADP-forming succinate--CoA ligase subunit beta [Candidatus Bathyarchaeota archaeon]
MKLLEYEAKEYFKQFGIPTPMGNMVTTPEDAAKYVESLGKPVVIKVQLPVGGRGKAGGVKFADTSEEAKEAAKQLLGMTIKDLKVEKLYVEEKVGIVNEIYLGVTIDRNRKQHVVLASSEGGMEIEEVAAKTPEKIVRFYVDPLTGLRSYHANYIASKLGYRGGMMRKFSSFVTKLYTLAVEMDAELTEINPLAEVADGFLAADARLNIDNNALFRHKELQERLLDSYQGELTEREMEARAEDLTYVELDGDIGIIGNGAGLTMATLDSVMIHGGKAANFLDLGGGATPERIGKAVKFVLRDERTKSLFVNVLGGITRCDYTAEGIVAAREELGLRKPIVVRMMGTKEEEGKAILKKNDIDTLDSMEEAAEKAVKLAGGDA